MAATTESPADMHERITRVGMRILQKVKSKATHTNLRPTVHIIVTL